MCTFRTRTSMQLRVPTGIPGCEDRARGQDYRKSAALACVTHRELLLVNRIHVGVLRKQPGGSYAPDLPS